MTHWGNQGWSPPAATGSQCHLCPEYPSQLSSLRSTVCVCVWKRVYIIINLTLHNVITYPFELIFTQITCSYSVLLLRPTDLEKLIELCINIINRALCFNSHFCKCFIATSLHLWLAISIFKEPQKHEQYIGRTVSIPAITHPGPPDDCSVDIVHYEHE